MLEIFIVFKDESLYKLIDLFILKLEISKLVNDEQQLNI